MQWERPEQRDSKQLSPNKEKTNIDRIQQTKASLDQTIEELNLKLQHHFQKKEQDLIEQYKLELIQAQKELNELKSTTNEEQIKNKMLQRKKELELERHHLIQTNLFFSKKCEEYKRKLTELMAEGKELQRELLFLDNQLNSTQKRKYQAMATQDIHLTPLQHSQPPQKRGQETVSNVLPLFSDRKPVEPSRRLANSVSVRETNKKNLVEESIAPKMKKNIIRSELPKQFLEKTPLEQLFEVTVEDVRGRRKNKKAMPSLKGEEFSDYEKRQIMQDFLSKEEVKRKIYQIIFETEDKKMMNLPHFTSENKVKISFEDIG